MFTGKRAFEARTLNELHAAARVASTLATPSSLVRDLDPAIERAILRCLERDPAERPSSALAVAAALPGGDPLAAALAAGETPSPEMVAAAGEQGALRRRRSASRWSRSRWSMLAVLTLRRSGHWIVHRIPLPKSIDSLTDRAQELLERIGTAIRRTTRHAAGRSTANTCNYAAAHRVSRPAPRSHPAAPARSYFWYRTSPPRARADHDEPRADSRPIRRLRCPACASFVSTPRGGCSSSTSMTPQVDDAAPGAAR